MHKRLRVVFMGTPRFAAIAFAHLLNFAGADVVGVYTQPDRPAGRNKALKASEVKFLAEKHSLLVCQPQNFKDPATVAALAMLKPDVLAVVAYGLILPVQVLAVPTLLPVNVHASLLPRYRGAAPVQRAIMDGASVTGVTIMRMEAGLDTGPVLLQQAMGIDINDTAGALLDDLAHAGGELLVKALGQLQQGPLQSFPQDDAFATHAAKLTKQEGEIDFTRTVKEVHAHIRGCSPWPGSYFFLGKEGQEPVSVQCEPGIYPFTEDVPFAGEAVPGTLGGVVGSALTVRCSDGWYAFTSLRPAGKKSMDGRAFYNGYCAKNLSVCPKKNCP